MSTQAGSIHTRTHVPTAFGAQQGEYSVARRGASATRSRRIDRAFGNGQIARGLGWVSVALGTVQLLAPRELARAIGVTEHAAAMRALGARELASGIAILTSPETAGTGLKARVAGDAMDLAMLTAAMMRGESEQPARTALATLAVAAVTALDVLATRRYELEAASAEVIIDIRKSIAINAPAEQLYRAWSDYERLPSIMRHLESVTVLEEGRSRWVARAPAGMRVEWEAEEVANEPNELIAWRSLPGSQIQNLGSVRFEPLSGRRGTLVTVEIEYRPPAGKLGARIAKLLGEEPEVQLQEDLRRFKQLIETGEISTTHSQPAGRRSLKFNLLSRKEPANAR